MQWINRFFNSSLWCKINIHNWNYEDHNLTHIKEKCLQSGCNAKRTIKIEPWMFG